VSTPIHLGDVGYGVHVRCFARVAPAPMGPASHGNSRPANDELRESVVQANSLVRSRDALVRFA
jgi:hypothetical protein